MVPETPRRLCLVPTDSKSTASTLSVPREPRHDAVHAEQVRAMVDDGDRRWEQRVGAAVWMWGADAGEAGVPSRRYRVSPGKEP